jgi:hypothetical protein
MKFYNTTKLSKILAVQAEIEGMKAQNAGRKVNKHDPAFWLSDFRKQADRLTDLSYLPDYIEA